MMKKDMIDKIDKALHEKGIIRLERGSIDANCLYGVPLLYSDKLLLIKYFYDFYQDGYKVVRMEDITAVYYDEEEQFYEKILKQEGAYTEIAVPELTDVSSWSSLFEKLKKLYPVVIVECEDFDEGDFYIGRIVDVGEVHLQFLHFDTMGHWKKETDAIDFNTITSVAFADRYSTVFSKYCEP